MKYRKFNKLEKKEVRHQVLTNALAGDGLYLYRNNTGADIALPRPTKSGLRSVPPRAEFQGDNYYMQMVRSGLLRLVKEIQAPGPLVTLTEGNTMTEKLILDQPDRVTHAGTTEHVVAAPAVPTPAKLNETPAEGQDILLNEGPVEGGFVIVGD